VKNQNDKVMKNAEIDAQTRQNVRI